MFYLKRFHNFQFFEINFDNYSTGRHVALIVMNYLLFIYCSSISTRKIQRDCLKLMLYKESFMVEP